MEGLTKEEFVAKYGYDPEANLSGTPTKRTSFGDGIRSLAVGAATAIPSVLALPAVVNAGVRGAYDAATSDKKFVDSFGENMLASGGKERIQQHVQDIARGYKEQFPDMTDTELQSLIQQYTNTKQFEDISQKQLVAGANLASRIEGTVRDVVGDTRTAKERSWIDSALEVIGGSIIGAPASLVKGAANVVAKNAVGRALVANPVSYGALRVAEAVTPVTLPLNPTNFALNAGVGIGLDQGLRYATGQDTAFSGGTPDGPSGLAGAAGVAAAIGGGLLASGRAATAAARREAERTALPQNYPNTPSVEAAFKQGSNEGSQLIAGPALSDQGVGVSPALENPSLFGEARRVAVRLENQMVDEAAGLRSIAREVKGPETAGTVEQLVARQGGSAGRDAANAEADMLYRPILESLTEMDDALRNAARRGWQMSSAEANNLTVERALIDDIAPLQLKVMNGTADQADQKRLGDLNDQLTALQTDDPTKRRQLINIARADMQAEARAFESIPELAKFREAVKTFNDGITDIAVKRGALDAEIAKEWRRRNPYYVPNIEDPLKGVQGGKRVIQSIWQRATKQITDQQMSDTNRSMFSTMDKTIADNANAATGAEKGAVSIPLDPFVAARNYGRNTLIEINKNDARIGIFDALRGTDADPSILVRNMHMERVEINGRNSFTFKELSGNPALQAFANKPEYVRQIRNGMVEFVRYGDPEVAALLRFAPDQFTGIIGAGKFAADTMKAFTTGRFAWAFAPINAIYDTSVGAIFRRNPNNVFGPLDKLVTQAFGEQIARLTTRRFDVISPFIGLPYHAAAAFTEVVAARSAPAVERMLLANPAMKKLADSVGQAVFKKSTDDMLKAINESVTMTLMNKGIMQNNMMDDLAQASTAYNTLNRNIPNPVKGAANFYYDVLSAIHGAPRRMIYAENFALLKKRYGGIPQETPNMTTAQRSKLEAWKKDIAKLEYDTQTLSGDMTRRAGSQTIRQLEATMPYTNAIRNSLHNMSRSLVNNDEGHLTYVYPRLFMALAGVAATMYMMNNWDENAKRDFNLNTPDWMKNRFIRIPTMETLFAWSRGENVPYTDDKVYIVPIGPDIAPLVAGVAAFMRGVGILPNDAINQADGAMDGLGKAMLDAVLPVFPPAINGPLAAFTGGSTIDIGSADSRGGSILRSPLATFSKGPQTEERSSLGSVSKTLQATLGALFGSSGAYVSAALDAGINAANFEIKDGQQVAREHKSYMDGLIAGSTTFINTSARRIPDYPILYKGYDKEFVQTPAWQAVKEQKDHISSIRGMRDHAEGPRSEAKREGSQAAGGVVEKTLKDPMLIAVADDVRKWEQGRKSEFTLLKQEYTNTAKARADLQNNYTLDNKTRTNKVNELTRLMQDNMDQQRLAIMYQEGVLQDKYGTRLAGKLEGKPLTFKELDRIMREDVARGLPSGSAGVFQASR
jgi:hypothetical protein